MTGMLSRRGFLGVSSAAGAAATLYSGGSSDLDEPDEGANTEEDLSPSPGQMAIAAVSAPASLDPGLATDTETERICRQIFEPLVGIDPETGALAPRLATEWETSDDELTYTFTLRDDVVFHDGAALTADVVVENFQRWGRLDYLYGFGNISLSTPLAFPSVFGGFLGSEDCVLESVEAQENTVVLTLSEPIVFLLQALTMPTFGIASAEVLADSDPGLVSRSPMGTGAYRLAENGVPDENDGTRLETFEEYWGTHTGPDEVLVRPLPKSFDRLRELQRGQADIYDFITADNLRSLVQSGRIILQRDPFSVLYMGFNLNHPVMADLNVRQAAARAIDRPELVQQLFLDGSRPAYQFTPAALGVHSDSALRHSYSLSLAQDLLQDSDYDGEPLDFYYPLSTTRSYLPRPEAVFAAIAADLTAAGFVIRPRPVRWDDGYVEQLMADPQRAFHLLGRNGGFRSPHAFLAPLFGQSSREFNFTDDEVRALLDEARGEPDEDARAELYREVADLIQDQLPAVPLAYPISGLALGSRVSDYPMSPVLNERFIDIQLADS